ncbi:MAG: RIP metalloprotease RseP [Candidatus Omnitrophica bacterium]|jgi:regulator of sigma E protease|nr:RIP metalloprotease RseP [Candidatus Omnitrophota bacterium]
MSLLITLIIFSILIVIHEFGHFIAAKQAGVKVEKFSIGFGPALLKIKGKETLFLVCLFPIGGYVKLAGDSRSEIKGLKYEFLSQSPGVKMRIVFAGPLFNYLLAFLIFIIIALVGFPYSDTVIGDVLEGYPAHQAGLKKGDKILEVNGKKVDNWQEMSEIIRKAKNGVFLKVDREKKVFPLEVSLKDKNIRDDFGREKKVSLIGISASSQIKIVKYPLAKAIVKGIESLFNFTFIIFKGFLLMILGIVPFKEAIAGPIGIFFITSEMIQVGIIALLQLVAILNLSLSIINLFPIPILDGGHIIFFGLERIRNKPLNQRTEDVLTRIGLVFLTLLMSFAIYNDLVKFGSRILKKDNGKIQRSLDY